MKRNMIRTAVFAGVLSLGLVTSAFADTRAERASRREAEKQAEGSNNRIGYDQLPGNVREALDRERGDRKVLSAYRADRADRSWYSVVFETRRRGPRVVRLSPRGYVLSVADLTPEETKIFKADPDRWYREWLDRQSAHEKFYAEHAARVTATSAHPETVRWEDIPARVRATILRENYGQRPENIVIRYREKDQIVYQVNLKEPGHEHMIKVTPEGAIFEEGDFDPHGKFVAGINHPKTVMEEDLPRAVRAAVDRESKRGEISHIDVFSRGGREVYTVEVDTRDTSRYITVSRDGKVLSDISDKY
jgi:hypothetical protein